MHEVNDANSESRAVGLEEGLRLVIGTNLIFVKGLHACLLINSGLQSQLSVTGSKC